MTMPYMPEALWFARDAAERMMTDVGVVTRSAVPTASTIVDPLTGLTPASGPPVVIYTGKCFLVERRIQNPTARAVAADYPYVETVTLMLPSNTPAIRVQDIFTLTAAPDHPQDVGLRFRITFFNPGTHSKVRKCQMEGITG